MKDQFRRMAARTAQAVGEVEYRGECTSEFAAYWLRQQAVLRLSLKGNHHEQGNQHYARLSDKVGPSRQAN